MNPITEWKEFNRFHNHTADGFYGCVAPDGTWFDSSRQFEIAVHWCCYEAGQYELDRQGEMDWMRDEGVKRGYSIIHSSMLEKMYEKGLLI
jgi:peptide methionine sulfoxide reductase MsrB